MAGQGEDKRGETFVIKGEGGAARAGENGVDFTTFVLGLASSALIHLGTVPNPETGHVEKNLVLAHQSLDLLSLLQEKTRGNLTAEEDKFFLNLLADLRLQYVESIRR